MARRNRGWPESFFGGVLGIALVCLFVAGGNLDFAPCVDGPVTLRPGEGPFHCGGSDPMPWLYVGLLLSLVALGGYAVFRGARRQATA